MKQAQLVRELSSHYAALALVHDAVTPPAKPKPNKPNKVVVALAVPDHPHPRELAVGRCRLTY